MATIASRLAHDERVQAAIYEEDQKHIRASAPRAIRSLSSLIENPGHRDHARGIAMVLAEQTLRRLSERSDENIERWAEQLSADLSVHRD
jgi:phage terminase small subunit